MEAFGNAKTVRNNNSSRFGKLISIVFDKQGAIVGGSIVNYLLERSRLVTQAKTERNYHVFYQIFHAGQSVAKELGIPGAKQFHYTNQSGVTEIAEMSDSKGWKETVEGLRILGISAEEQTSILALLAAILHLGNLEIETEAHAVQEDAARVKEGKSRDALKKAAELLQVPAADLEKALLSRNIGNRSVILVPYTVCQAIDARDATSKKLYSNLFDWIIFKINAILRLSGKDLGGPAISVLDIFGFESFEHNSFEQLCINYCNEKLQFHFNEHIFSYEQVEYAAEGIEVSTIDFANNKPCLDLMEIKGTGLFAMIDEEINVPKGSDDTLLSKIMSKHSTSKNLSRPKPKQCPSPRDSFVVVHYAGEVAYDVRGFLDKNKDTLHGDIEEILKSSASDFIQNLMTTVRARSKTGDGGSEDMKPSTPKMKRGGGGKKKQPTLAASFKKQLTELMTTLNATNPYFIRCMKPNAEKKGRLFTPVMMLGQLRYAGLVEVCRIRQVGFPVRFDNDVFCKMFKCLGPVAAKNGAAALCDKLADSGDLQAGQWAVGKSKIFLRQQQATNLDIKRNESFSVIVVCIQTLVRRFLGTMYRQKCLLLLQEVDAVVKARKKDDLERCLDKCATLPNNGTHLQSVKDAKALLPRLIEEDSIDGLLRDAISSRSVEGLASAVKLADAMSPPLTSPAVVESKALLAQLQKEKELNDKLSDAMERSDREELGALLDTASDIGLKSDAVSAARALYERLGEEAEAVEGLEAAMEARNTNLISAFLTKMTELGIDHLPQAAAALKLQKEMQEEKLCKTALQSATSERALEPLVLAIEKSAAFGLDASCKELVAAKALCAVLEKEAALEKTITNAMKSKDLAALEGALQKAAEAANELNIVGGSSLDGVIKNAQALKTQMMAMKDAANKEQQLQTALTDLEASLQSDDLEVLQNALTTATALNLEEKNAALVNSVKGKVESMHVEAALEKNLKNAVASQEPATLKTALQKYAESPGQRTAALATLHEQATTLLTELEQRDAILARLGSAIEVKDMEALAKATDEAVKLSAGARRTSGIGAHPLLQQAQTMLDRGDTMNSIKSELTDAMASNDLADLNTALQHAIEVGFRGPEVIAAQLAVKTLSSEKGKSSELSAVCKTLKVKASSHNGTSAEDVALLETTIQAVKDSSSDAPELEEAENQLALLKEQLSIQQRLRQAMDEQDHEEIFAAFDDADLMELNLKLMDEARPMLSGFQRRERVTSVAQFDDEEPAERKARHKRMLETAAQPRYRFTKWEQMRDPEDYAKTVRMNRKGAKDKMLKWQKSVITRSLQELPRNLEKESLLMHKSVLGFCGEKSLAYPATLAIDMMKKALSNEELATEAYILGMKHATENSNKESEAKAWHLLCAFVNCFLPKSAFVMCLWNFFQLHLGVHGQVGVYAKYCMRRLEGLVQTGSLTLLPDVEEIDCFCSRPPILVTLVEGDGNAIANELPLTPDFNEEKLKYLCMTFANISKENLPFFGLFVDTSGLNTTLGCQPGEVWSTDGEDRLRPSMIPKGAFIADYFLPDEDGVIPDFKIVFQRY
jgi:myosin heavy subunit